MNKHFLQVNSLLIASFLFAFTLNSCKNNPKKDAPLVVVNADTVVVKSSLYTHFIPKNVQIKDYFKYMDSLARVYDSLVPYDLTAHLIVRTNPWLMDSLENTDYYRQKEKGVSIYDQKELIILKQGDSLLIPTDTIARQILAKQAQTMLDVNIPEFKLRIVEGADTIGTFAVRVGQNRITKWAIYDKKNAKLRTKTGNGKIIKTYLKSTFLDPANGKTSEKTKRDDGDSTFLPLMPWLEPEINGESFGQLIHPTSNENSLGKAYSNGCIGTGEGSMWRIYYYAPVGTKVRISYRLNTLDSAGTAIKLKDIYGKKAVVK
jgi:lipoprotein-anchoring transpeptidase ErfK/SrfK